MIGKENKLELLMNELGLSLSDNEALVLAFVHSSYINESPLAFPKSNERLEFLGDALIGLVIAHEVYYRHSSLSEGDLTAMRSILVSGDTLAKVANALQLGQHLLMGKGEESSGGRIRESNLAAAFEALVGAIFLDRGYNEARNFVLTALAGPLSSVGEGISLKDPKSFLQEFVQGVGKEIPVYVLVSMNGEDHDRTFTVEVMVSGKMVGRGIGRRKSIAEREAASDALREMGQQV